MPDLEAGVDQAFIDVHAMIPTSEDHGGVIKHERQNVCRAALHGAHPRFAYGADQSHSHPSHSVH